MRVHWNLPISGRCFRGENFGILVLYPFYMYKIFLDTFLTSSRQSSLNLYERFYCIIIIIIVIIRQVLLLLIKNVLQLF